MSASRLSVGMIRRVIPNPLLEMLRRLFERTTNHRLRIFDTFHRSIVRHQVIYIGVSSGIERFRVRSYSSKEPETLDWLDNMLGPGDVLYDIGANIGLYSLYAATSQPKAKVFAFEPHPVNFQRLCRNILANKLGNVVPCSIALTDTLSFDTFHVSGFEAGIAFNSVGQINDLRNREREMGLTNVGIGVITTSIDQFVEQLKAPPPTLIKLDVDGNEEAIVSGALQTLKRASVKSILVEVNRRKSETSRIEEIFAEIGFKVSTRGETIEREQVIAQNVIFVRK